MTPAETPVATDPTGEEAVEPEAEAVDQAFQVGFRRRLVGVLSLADARPVLFQAELDSVFVAGDLAGLPQWMTGARDAYSQHVVGITRMHATCLEPLHLLSYLIVPLCLALSLWLHRTSVIGQRWQIAVLAAGSICVVLAAARSGIVALVAALMLALAVGILVRWKDTPFKWLLGMLTPVLIASVILGGLGSLLFGDFNWAVLAVCLLGAWVVLASARDLLDKTRHKGLGKGMRSLSPSYWGMHLAHIGLVVCAIGVVLTSHQSAERDLRLAPGESLELGGYRFVFEGAVHHEGPNFTSDKATIRVLDGDKQVATLHPEKRLYTVQQMPMTEAGIDAGFTRDLYVALGEPLDGGAWAVRVHIKPFVRWIWLGGLMMALGGVLAASDRRYRVKVKTRVREALGMAAQGA